MTGCISKQAPRFMAVIVGLTLLASCASGSLFNPYPRQAQDYIKAAKSGDIPPVTERLILKRDDADNLLYLQESARLNQLDNQFNNSQQDLTFVLQRYDDIDESARISVGRLAAQGTSLISNENAIPYAGQAYERIFAHQYQVFNYLAANDIEGASVEVRRAANAQRQQELRHEKEIAKAETEAQKNQVNSNQWMNEPALAGMNSLSSSVRNSFLNAYTYYTSAVIWEAQGDLNAAMVDYKKALEIHPQSAQLLAAVRRIDSADKNRFNKTLSSDGKLVILYEEGFVPARRSFNLSIPSFHYETYFSIAVPFYDAKAWPSASTLTVYSDEARLGETEILVNVSSLAVKSLQENMSALIVRQVLRARTKHEIQQQAQQQSDLGGFVATLYNIVSEQADLRSWLTLPNTAQGFYHELPAGSHTLQLQSAAKKHTIDVNIAAGRTTVIRVIDVGKRFIVQPFHL